MAKNLYYSGAPNIVILSFQVIVCNCHQIENIINKQSFAKSDYQCLEPAALQHKLHNSEIWIDEITSGSIE